MGNLWPARRIEPRRDEISVTVEGGRIAVSTTLSLRTTLNGSTRSSADAARPPPSAVPDTQKASCWISLNRSATYAYISNTGSGTISSYQIDGGGGLTLAKAIAANTGGAPIDSSLSRDSKFIYVLDSANGRVLILHVNGEKLVPIGSVSSLPTSIQGIAAQ